MRPCPSCASVVLTAMLWGSGLLAAPLSPERAQSFKRFVAQAAQRFQEGRYDDAIAAFEAAYAIKQDPALLFNMGNAHRRAGHLEDALATYQRLLAVDPETPQRAEVRGYMAELRTRLDLRVGARRAEGGKAAARGEDPDPAVQLGRPVPVEFVATQAETHYQVRAVNGRLDSARARQYAATCDTPCLMKLFPGENQITVTGDGAFYKTLSIPGHQVRVELTRRPRTALAGQVLLGVGGGLVLLGLSVLPLAVADGKLYAEVGGPFLGVGAVLGIVGGVLWGTAPNNSMVMREGTWGRT